MPKHLSPASQLDVAEVKLGFCDVSSLLSFVGRELVFFISSPQFSASSPGFYVDGDAA